MNEEHITITIPEGLLLADVEVFLRDQGCTFTGYTEYGIAHRLVTFPTGTTRTPIIPQSMELGFWLTFSDGTRVRATRLQGQGRGPTYRQILWSEENPRTMITELEWILDTTFPLTLFSIPFLQREITVLDTIVSGFLSSKASQATTNAIKHVQCACTHLQQAVEHFDQNQKRYRFIEDARKSLERALEQPVWPGEG